MCPSVPVLTLDESKLPKRKNLLSESEEPEGTESIRFTSRGLDQELIRQVDLSPYFLNVYEAQESIPRNKFRQPM
jgi:hypothetical protein